MNEVQSGTLKRIMSAVVALPVYLYTIITDSFQSLPVLLVSLIITLACLYEFYLITDKGEDGKPFIKTGLIAAFFINITMYLFGFGKIYGYSKFVPVFDARVIMGIIILFMAVVLLLQVFTRHIKGGIYSMAVTAFGIIYIVFFFSHIILMKSLSNGLFYIIILNVVIMLNDSGAYFGGVLFGKHKTGFEVSPNKSWEGYFSGLLFGILGMMLTNQIYISFFSRELFSMFEAVILGIILSILGSAGDLIESAVKRDASIKDSGSIIPGHGGMWDVFDALIFTFPLFYYYLVIKGVH